MNYIDIYCFLEDPEGSWREIVKENKIKYQNSLFPELEGAYFWKQRTWVLTNWQLGAGDCKYSGLPDNNEK